MILYIENPKESTSCRVQDQHTKISCSYKYSQSTIWRWNLRKQAFSGRNGKADPKIHMELQGVLKTQNNLEKEEQNSGDGYTK